MSEGVSNIVITGVGLASPLGLSAEETWANVLQNRCGIAPAKAIDGPLPPGSDVGQCPDLPADFSPELPRPQRYLRWAMRHAMHSADVLDRLPCAPQRATVMLGTTLHGMPAGGRFLRDGDFDHLKQFLAGDVLAGAIGDWPLHGGRMTTCSACSSSLGSVALGVTLLQSNAADLVITGGYDPISEYAWAGFNSLRLISGPPLRPFTRGRSGMKVSESYAIVILERADDAERRSAKPLCAIAGWGESADAHHLTQPKPDGEGAFRAMGDALRRAAIVPQQIGLIAAHATGTPDNDSAESSAILAFTFHNRETPGPVVGFKSHLGHTLGGAGAAELILSACAMRDQTVPGTANIDLDAIEYPGLRLAPAAAPAKINYTLNTSLGFGGANTSVILSRETAFRPRGRGRPPQQVVITGIGVLLPGVTGKAEFAERLRLGSPLEAGDIEDASYESLIAARRTRRMSKYVKLSLAAVALACRDAGLDDFTAFAEKTAGLLGTMHGSAGYCYDYYRQIIDEGPLAANPILFAEGVPNAAAAQLSLMLGLKQSCQTLLGTRTSGLDALRLAFLRVAAGDWPRAIVSAGEEFHPTINAAYEHCGLRRSASQSGFDNAACSIALVVESADAAAQRWARPLAQLTHTASASGSPADLPRTVAGMLTPFTGRQIVSVPAAGTWLERGERAGVAKIESAQSRPMLLPELFSASGLAAVAAAIALRGNVSFTALSTDFTGVATAVQGEVA